MKHILTICICGSLLLAAGCAGRASGAKGRPALTISIGEENVRVGERTFPIGDAEAMRAGLAGACAHGCDQVEIRAIPMARYDAVLASYSAAVENDAERIQLRIAASKPVPLAPGEAGSPSAPCLAEVVLRRHAIDVYVNGEILPPDPQCDEWGATVCDSKTQDPLKRQEFNALGAIVRQYRVRFATGACIYAESEMPAMLLDHLIHAVSTEAETDGPFTLRRDRRTGKLRDEDVTAAIVDQGAALTACYDVEMKETRSPMEAVVRFLIGPSGRVLRVEFRDKAMTTPRFEECLMSAVKGLSFPKPDNGGTVEITYPLRFSPRPGLSG